MMVQVLQDPMDALARNALADAHEEAGAYEQARRQRQIARILKRGKIKKKNSEGKKLMQEARKRLLARDARANIVPATDWLIPEGFFSDNEYEPNPIGEIADYSAETDDWQRWETVPINCRVPLPVKQGKPLAIELKGKVTILVHPDEAPKYGI